MHTIKLLLICACFALGSCIGTDDVDFPLGQDMSSLSFSEPSLALSVGQTQQLMVNYTDFNGEAATVNLVWMSIDETVASISAAGLLTAIGPGQTTVSAQIPSGLMASILVTVVENDASIATIIIEGTSTTMQVGVTQVLTAKAQNVNGEPVAFNTISWQSSDASVASVDANGLVTALGSGQANIQCEIEGVLSNPFSINVPSAARTGSFGGLNGYNVSGTSVVSDSLIVFESDFSSSNGPGLFVYLSNDPRSVAGGVEIARLQSNQGAQTYELNASIDPTVYTHVLVYCKPFGASFGAARLE